MSISLFGISDFDNGIEMITKAYKRKAEQCNEARKELAEYRKDEEIEKLEKEIASLHGRSLYMMTAKERDADNRFRGKHHQKCKNGSTFQYELAGTGIGVAISVRCPVCGEEENITDYDCW